MKNYVLDAPVDLSTSTNGVEASQLIAESQQHTYSNASIMLFASDDIVDLGNFATADDVLSIDAEKPLETQIQLDDVSLLELNPASDEVVLDDLNSSFDLALSDEVSLTTQIPVNVSADDSQTVVFVTTMPLVDNISLVDFSMY